MAISCLKNSFCFRSIKNAVNADNMSLIGILHHTPKSGLFLKRWGNSKMSGMRYKTCLVRLKKIDFFGIPMDVKKFMVTI